MTEAFAHPVTRGIVVAALLVLVLASAAIAALSATGRISPALRRELWLRTGSWAVLLPLMLGPVLIGRVATILAVTVLGLLCLREYDRATGLFREVTTAATVALGILAVNAAALDGWYALFMALIPLVVGLLAVVTIPLDRPEGYIQRTGLAVFAFMLFGVALSHLGYMANDPNYRPLVLMLLTTVAINDVFAFTCGKLIGGRKLLPATSPNKTVSGALGALVCTSVLVALIAWPIFRGTALGHWHLLLGLGAIVSLGGQFGDLMLSSIKRDLGIKDMGAVIPGHGGLLDRFNSLLLVAPASFHYVNYFAGLSLGQPTPALPG
ncbi:phosphatidate cytidylyltransferase [Roseomonas elaeocarpi]|uniref:Phosphatidate cytidylyltransferase n=1 Tax=Roseomonas elaeocarpi TaxID=907779 RepID=A0ABV6JVX1_9PROT